MKWPLNATWTHRLFVVSVVLKGIDGIVELLGGALLYLLPHAVIVRVVTWLTWGELSEDPQDWVANHLLSAARHLSSRAQAFAALYLVAHGVIKTGLMLGLIFRKRAAYPVAMVFLLLFMDYQVYRFVIGHGIAMLLLTLLDGMVVALIWNEYGRMRSEERKNAP